MRLLRMNEPKQFELVECEEPQIKKGFAKLKMEYCGICGSDLTAYLGTNLTVKYPVNGIGHEGIGIITEIEENERGLKAGDRVAFEPYIPCWKCHMCAEERFNNCEDIHVAGVHTDGVMADYVVFPIEKLYKVPDGLSPLKAALTEPLTIGLHGAARARVKPGEYCLVTGAGPIGLLAALGLKNNGAIPILADIIDERLQFAHECGIEYTVNNSKENLVAYLHKVTGTLPDAMLDCTGSAFILGNMHDYVRHGGRIAMIGWPKGPVTINTVRCMQKELDLLPSRNSNKQFPNALRMISEGKIPADKFISKVIELEEVEKTIKDMIANPGNYIKTVVKIEK